MEKIAYDLSLTKKRKEKWKKDGRIKRDKCSAADSQEEASIFYRDYIFHGRIVMAPKSPRLFCMQRAMQRTTIHKKLAI